MATQRHYEATTAFNVRIVDMRHLWVPSTEYKGKKQDMASYFASFITPKTRAAWHEEPVLAGISAACGKLYQASPGLINWPITDGDLPNAEGKQSEWAKGHWMFSASTYNNPPNVEIVQAGGALAKLTAKIGVKSGDYCMVGVTASPKADSSRGVKLFLNAVVFTGPGEEIVFANSVSGAELMAAAQAQGLQVSGFSDAPSQDTLFGGNPGPAPTFAPSGAASPTFGTAPAASVTSAFPSNTPPNPFGGPR